MKTLLEILNSGTDYLTKHGCDEARLTMQHLMAHVLQCSRTQLYSEFDRPMGEEELSTLRRLIKQRTDGTPLQHLLGTTEFFRREFLTDDRALIPRPETEELVELILRRRLPDSPRILDMGCGSGIIGITLALELEKASPNVTLADISEAALSLTLENAMKLGAKITTRESDLFSAFEPDDKEEAATEPPPLFDVIAANLPYISRADTLEAHVLRDPHTALFGGEQGWELIERFLEQAPRFLSPNGFVALEIGHDQSGKVCEIMQKLHYTNISVEKDINGIPRFPFASKPVNVD